MFVEKGWSVFCNVLRLSNSWSKINVRITSQKKPKTLQFNHISGLLAIFNHLSRFRLLNFVTFLDNFVSILYPETLPSHFYADLSQSQHNFDLILSWYLREDLASPERFETSFAIAVILFWVEISPRQADNLQPNLHLVLEKR